MKLTPTQVVNALKEAPSSELNFILKHLQQELTIRAESEKKLQEMTNSLSSEEKNLIHNGRPIEAIKRVRARTGLDLKTSKDIVDVYRDAHKF